MKTMILILALVTASVSFATTFKTADNVGYLVLVDSQKSNERFKQCGKQIEEITTAYSGEITAVFARFSLIAVNVSSAGADSISRLACVRTIELEGQVEAQPRVGRSN